MDSTFDRGSEDSPFFRFVAKEFIARGTELRKKLGTKDYGSSIAAGLGLKSAQTFEVSGTPESILARSLPERFVLKYAHGWSARGVMLLQATDIPDHFFEQLSQRLLPYDRLIETQYRVSKSFPNKPDEWLLEEWLPSVTPGPVPFDYKLYTFGTAVGLIVQIDRNTYPVKIALFDGAFNPLHPGRDYILSDSAQYGQHLLPKHPLQLLRWAATLSQQTDSPFVSIDLFDTPDGPAFGEFTFSPGGLHKRMWRLSAEVISMLDARFMGDGQLGEYSWLTTADTPDFSPAALARFDVEELAQVEHISPLLYENWSRYFYNHGRRGAVRLSEHYAEAATLTTNSAHATFLRALSQRWEGLASAPAPPNISSQSR